MRENGRRTAQVLTEKCRCDSGFQQPTICRSCEVPRLKLGNSRAGMNHAEQFLVRHQLHDADRQHDPQSEAQPAVLVQQIGVAESVVPQGGLRYWP